MKKATYIIQPSPKGGNAYQLILKRCQMKFTMGFNDWLQFLDTILHKKKADDFDLYRLFTGVHAFIIFYENGFVVEIQEPHQLNVYAKSVCEATVRRYLELYQPKYSELRMMPHGKDGLGWTRPPISPNLYIRT